MPLLAVNGPEPILIKPFARVLGFLLKILKPFEQQVPHSLRGEFRINSCPRLVEDPVDEYKEKGSRVDLARTTVVDARPYAEQVALKPSKGRHPFRPLRGPFLYSDIIN